MKQRSRFSYGLALVSIGLIAALVLSGCGAPAAEPAAPEAEAAAPAAAAEDMDSGYKEAPLLAALVASGDLPPVEERLPAEPVVSTAPDIGTYSDTLAHHITVGIDYPFNMYVVGNLNRLQLATYQGMAIFSVEEEPVLEPDLATHWEISEDGRETTVHLRPGVKWSDGVPFTTDDIMFTFEDVIMNDELANPRAANIRKVFDGYGGVTFEQIDEYTFKMIATDPAPALLEEIFVPRSGWQQFYTLPKHEMENVHPKYNADATLADWQGARLPADRPAVLMPWAPTGVVGDKLVSERNPYYWKVDASGQQLPYFDRFVFKLISSPSDIALGLVSGELQADLHGGSMMEAGLVKQNEAAANISLVMFEEISRIHGLWFNFDHMDPSMNWLINNPKFTDALSMIMDRQRMSERVSPVVVPDRSPLPDVLRWKFPDIDAKYELKYDPEGGLALLEEIGVVDTDGDGWREFPEGQPRAGEPIGWRILVAIHDTSRVRTGEDFAQQMKDIGFEVEVDPINETLMYENFVRPADYDALIRSPAFDHNTRISLDESRLNSFLLPIREDAVPDFQRLTGLESLMSWQQVWFDLSEQYEAGELDEEEGLRQLAEVIAQDGWRVGIPLTGFRAFSVVSNDIGNNPRLYHPYYSKHVGPSFTYSWAYFIHGRIFEWYQK